MIIVDSVTQNHDEEYSDRTLLVNWEAYCDSFPVEAVNRSLCGAKLPPTGDIIVQKKAKAMWESYYL